MTGYISKKMLSDARLPDTPTARMILKKMLEDDDVQVYQRPWVGLTKEERVSFEAANPKTQEEWDKLFNGIEAKFKERNHG